MGRGRESNFARLKVPERLTLVSEIPRKALGKIDRALL
jgi:acyl-CoA synthetase (AMP-forming)/AMP-acid ligase II